MALRAPIWYNGGVRVFAALLLLCLLVPQAWAKDMSARELLAWSGQRGTVQTYGNIQNAYNQFANMRLSPFDLICTDKAMRPFEDMGEIFSEKGEERDYGTPLREMLDNNVLSPVSDFTTGIGGDVGGFLGDLGAAVPIGGGASCDTLAMAMSVAQCLGTDIPTYSMEDIFGIQSGDLDVLNGIAFECMGDVADLVTPPGRIGGPLTSRQEKVGTPGDCSQTAMSAFQQRRYNYEAMGAPGPPRRQAICTNRGCKPDPDNPATCIPSGAGES